MPVSGAFPWHPAVRKMFGVLLGLGVGLGVAVRIRREVPTSRTMYGGDGIGSPGPQRSGEVGSAGIEWVDRPVVSRSPWHGCPAGPTA